MINIDGINYNAEWLQDTYTLDAQILNGSNTGRLQGTGSLFLEYIGTFYNASGTLHRTNDCSDVEWDNLYDILSNPINNHNIKVPFKNGYLTIQSYVTNCQKKLLSKTNNKWRWKNALEVKFTATDSNWLAGGSLQGYTEGV